MAKKLFYNKHSLAWMRKFIKAIPEKSHLSKTVAFCLAAAIHHQVTLKKSKSIRLTHDVLKEFSLNRRHLKNYLECFQQANLIRFSISQGSAPFVELLVEDEDTIW